MKVDIRLIIILFLSGIAVSGCGSAPPALKNEINAPSSEFTKINSVVVTSSAGHVEVSGPSKGADFILGLSTLLFMPGPGIIVSNVIGQSEFSRREEKANKLLPRTWVEQQMTSAFVRAASDGRLFEVINSQQVSPSEPAVPDATIHLNLDKIDIITGTTMSGTRENDAETTTLFATGTARLTSSANALLWQATETARASDLSPDEIQNPDFIRQECQLLVEKLASKFVRDLAYARQ